jgi:hypothetical protein
MRVSYIKNPNCQNIAQADPNSLVRLFQGKLLNIKKRTLLSIKQI